MYRFLPRRLMTTLQTVFLLVLGFMVTTPALSANNVSTFGVTALQDIPFRETKTDPNTAPVHPGATRFFNTVI